MGRVFFNMACAVCGVYVQARRMLARMNKAADRTGSSQMEKDNERRWVRACACARVRVRVHVHVRASACVHITHAYILRSIYTCACVR